MPIPMITEQILASTKPLLPGWNLLQLVSTRNVPSGNSVNYWFDFEVVSGPGNTEDNKSKKTSFMVAGNGLVAGIDSLCRAYQQLLSSLTGLSGEELQGKEVDETKLVGGKVWSEIDHRINDGKEFPDFKKFAPANQIPW